MKLAGDKRKVGPSGLHSRSGLTLIELMVAAGLSSLILIALVTLVQTSLGVWGRTETRRDLLEQATAISELIADDLSALEAGARGDLLVDWNGFDTDSDGINGLFQSRVRMIRRVSAAELSRRGYLRPRRESDDPEAVEIQRTGALLEVVWVHLPGEIGSLHRGERLVTEELGPLIFDPNYFDQTGNPPLGELQEVSRSVLWFGPVFASQTSDLSGEWKVGQGLFDCGVAWDARTSNRLDAEVSTRNSMPTGSPTAKELPVFPRRIRFEIEIEREKDLGRRTTLAEAIDQNSTKLKVRDKLLAPKAGDFLRLDEEWMEVLNTDGALLSVARGVRGTRNTTHVPGGLIHFGKRTVRELRVSAYRENWNL
jgi:hypothetical protein